MVCPVPRRITGRGSTSGASSAGFSCDGASPDSPAEEAPATGASSSAASRRMEGAGAVAQAASTVASRATSIGRNWERLIVTTLRLLAGRRLLGLAPQLLAPGLDALADGFDLGIGRAQLRFAFGLRYRCRAAACRGAGGGAFGRRCIGGVRGGLCG